MENCFPILATKDGLVQIINVYPKFDITDIHKTRKFFSKIRTSIQNIQSKLNLMDIEIHYSGEVLRIIDHEAKLFTQILKSARSSILWVCLLLLFALWRSPIGGVITLISLLMPLIWTLGIVYVFVGQLTLVTSSISLLLIGLGMSGAIFLLGRYFEEKRKGLSPQVAFETITLETGPAITTGMLALSAAFFALTFSNFKGISEFGILAGVGMLCTWFSILLILPCLLILAEKYFGVSVYGKKIYNYKRFNAKPYLIWPWNLLALFLLSTALLSKGLQFQFEYNKNELNYKSQASLADSLLKVAGQFIVEPGVGIVDNDEKGTLFAQIARKYVQSDTLTPTISNIKALTDLLPAKPRRKA